eukprot:3105193-Amphidinium_carterae.1
MLSGRSTVVMSTAFHNVEQIVERCCRRLGMDRSGNEKLVHGTEVVPARASMENWPGFLRQGQVSEYQLIV